jgi:hypothetical protein
MPLSVDALYRANVSYELYGQTCVNSYFFRTREDSHSDTLDEEVDFLANDLFNWVIEPALNFMSNQVSLVGWTVTTLFPLDGPFQVREGGTHIGAVAEPALPSYSAAVVSMQTGLTGKRLHGRTYLCGVPGSYCQGNDLTDVGFDVLKGYATSIKNRYGNDGTSNRVRGGVYSRANGVTRDPGPPPTLHYSPLALVPWRNAIARRIIYTQRHRLSGRGI